MDEYIKRETALEIVKRTSGDYATAFCQIKYLPAEEVVREADAAAKIFAEIEAVSLPGCLGKYPAMIISPSKFEELKMKYSAAQELTKDARKEHQ